MKRRTKIETASPGGALPELVAAPLLQEQVQRHRQPDDGGEHRERVRAVAVVDHVEVEQIDESP